MGQGQNMQALTFFFAFVAVLALIGAAAWLVRRFAGNRLGANTNRGRMPRLAVIDAAAVDGRRRLVLVRRDNIEHLLMIGGPTDIVVEPNIVRATARDQMSPRPAVTGTEPPPRVAPLPDPGWSDGDGARADGFDHPEPQMPEPPRPVRPSFADELRRPAPAVPERRGDPLSSFAPEPLGGRTEPRPELRNEPLPPRVTPRSEPIMPRPRAERSAEGAAGSRRRTRRAAIAAAATRHCDIFGGPESRRDGAAAGGGVAPAGRGPRRAARRRAAGRPRAAASPQPAARRTDGTAGCPPSTQNWL